MKYPFYVDIQNKGIDFIVLPVRLSIGSFMLTHGIPKLMRFFGDGPLAFGDPIGIGVVPSLVLTTFAEVVCSILLILGLGTRLAALVLIINFVVAAFIAHAGSAFGVRELALLYLVFYILLYFTGGGTYSLDYLLHKRAASKVKN